MTTTITRTYDRFEDARDVVAGLKGIGIQQDAISVIAHDEHHAGSMGSGSTMGTGSGTMGSDTMNTGSTVGTGSGMGTNGGSYATGNTPTGVHDGSVADPDSGVGTGAGIGSVVGGGAGLLAGLGLMAIPGIGPLVAAGWLATTAAGAAAGALAGAATGGLVGALTDSGIPEREAHTYAESVRRGGILVSVRTEEADEMRVSSIMDRYNPADLNSRRAHWEEEGWSGYDASSRPYSRDQVIAEQDRYR